MKIHRGNKKLRKRGDGSRNGRGGTFLLIVRDPRRKHVGNYAIFVNGGEGRERGEEGRKTVIVIIKYPC